MNDLTLPWREKVAYLLHEFLRRPQVECPVTHSFEPGLYLRDITIAAGTVFIGRPHRHGHRVDLVSGSVWYITEAGSRQVDAPFTVMTQAGDFMVLYAMTDVLGRTFHPNPTESRDTQALEDEAFEPVADLVRLGAAVADRVGYRQMLAQYGIDEAAWRPLIENEADQVPFPSPVPVTVALRHRGPGTDRNGSHPHRRDHRPGADCRQAYPRRTLYEPRIRPQRRDEAHGRGRHRLGRHRAHYGLPGGHRRLPARDCRGGTVMSGVATAIGIGAVGLVGDVLQGQAAGKQGQITNSEIGIMNAQNTRQQTSFDQLQQLMANPASFFSSPVYQAAFGQGTQAVARSNAAGGFNNSGNMATALQQYGQSFGQQQLLGQEQLLAGMSGTGFNPAAAGGAATTSNTNQTGLLAGLFASFGGQMNQFGGGGGGVATVDQGMTTGGYGGDGIMGGFSG